MAYVTTSSPVFYSGGSSGASSVVGYEAKRTRVVRYSFTTSAEGATRLDVWISKVYRGDSDCKATTASALITTNGSSVPSIGTASTATLTWGSSNNVMSGVISYTFLPSTTYTCGYTRQARHMVGGLGRLQLSRLQRAARRRL